AVENHRLAGNYLQEDTTLHTTCGPFSFDGVSVQGPPDYRNARGVELLDAILAEQDAAYDPTGYPDEELAVLGRPDDDFQRGSCPLQHPRRRSAGGSDGGGATPWKSNAIIPIWARPGRARPAAAPSRPCPGGEFPGQGYRLESSFTVARPEVHRSV